MEINRQQEKKKCTLLAGRKSPRQRMKEVQAFKQLRRKILLFQPSLIGDSIKRKILYGFVSFSHKHLNRRRNLHSKSRIYSTTWSALLGEEVIKNGIKWIATNIKNGISCLSLWFDKWMSEGPLRSLIVRLRNRGEKALLLKDFIQHNHWNWGSISFVIPPEEDKI